MSALELTNRRCLVTGASGFVGSGLAARLAAGGARVRCLVRRSSRLDFLPASDVELVYGDVTEPSSLSTAVDEAELIFHVAGLIKARRPEDYFRVNYLGTINLLEACRKASGSLQRVVVVSSLAAVGPSLPGRPVDESSPCRPVTPYGRSKLQAEHAARAYQANLPVTVVRPPTVYGPRDRETLLIFRAVSLGIRPTLPGGSEISVVHVDDLCAGIILAALQPDAVGRTYFLADDGAPSAEEIIEAIGEAVGRPGLTVPVPAPLVRGAARVSEVLRDLLGVSTTFDRWKAEEILSGYWACSNARARAELGFVPRKRLRTALAETARWYREQGWL